MNFNRIAKVCNEFQYDCKSGRITTRKEEEIRQEKEKEEEDDARLKKCNKNDGGCSKLVGL